MVSRLIIRKDESMGDDYVDEKIEQYERKLKQAEKAGKHHNGPTAKTAARRPLSCSRRTAACR